MMQYWSWLIASLNIIISYFSKKNIVEQIKYIIFDKLIKYHKLSKKINDGNKLFTSNYWKTLILLLNVIFKIFTIYHLKVDNQTKLYVDCISAHQSKVGATGL